MPRPLVYITHSSPHHAQHSGYTQLLKYIPNNTISGHDSTIPYRMRKGIAKRVSRDILLYDSNSVTKEFRLIRKMLTTQNGIAHFLNGERDIHFSPMFKQFNNWGTIASFHEPPDIIAHQLKTTGYIQRLNGAIAVGLSQLDYLQSKIGGNAVEYIPHGIDTQFFTPTTTHTNITTYAVFVGVHYRDFDAIEPFMDQIIKKYPDFKLKAVVGKEYTKHVPKHKNIEVCSGLSDEALRMLYQEASFLFLPLKEVTACNAILEALACGLPIITTDLESNRGYVNSDCSFLIRNNNTNELANAAIALIEDENLNRQMRILAREQSLNFSWEVVALQMTHYYKQHFNY